MGPIGAARVGYIAGDYKLNPQIDEMVNSELDLVVAGTADAVLMVELEAKELPEEVVHLNRDQIAVLEYQARGGRARGCVLFRNACG